MYHITHARARAGHAGINIICVISQNWYMTICKFVYLYIWIFFNLYIWARYIWGPHITHARARAAHEGITIISIIKHPKGCWETQYFPFIDQLTYYTHIRRTTKPTYISYALKVIAAADLFQNKLWKYSVNLYILVLIKFWTNFNFSWSLQFLLSYKIYSGIHTGHFQLKLKNLTEI